MDALFHFIFALAGGYILLKGLNIKFNSFILIFLALCSLLIDIEHVFELMGIFEYIKLHTLITITIPLLILMIFYLMKKGSYELYGYLLTLSVMLFGAVVADMIKGMYGVPLFYPLSDTLYMIPKNREIYFLNKPGMPIVSVYGIAMLIYFGLIGLIISGKKLLESGKLK
ncbi:MAG: hypothetical protein CVT90_01105 [Candidatus Altiarchaeales archaeon HGW-Altiarchaeales-3]|nr:MAG: hypothetical protein CVT90_01105 [Candidatus Altiarchaeales archaeon HGW-Altiarchaeales-3]